MIASTAPAEPTGSWASALVALLVFVLFGVVTALSVAWQQHEAGVLFAVVFVFAFGPLIDELPIIRWMCGTMPVGATYTCWNCMLLTYTVADYVLLGRSPLLLPALVTNSWAIVAAFNVVRLFDSSLYCRAAEWTGYPLPAFHVFNQLFHTLPAIVATAWFVTARPSGACTLGLPILSTMAFHMAWAARVAQSVFLDKVYFECPRWEWGVAWAAALFTHVAIGSEVAWQCRGESW
eukprot:CAMPEP_0168448662 /NCGR_PEP_ID=MMETSP0228-20121227/47208_1 /TAXON_ID=133427 /ORGANISM="Protoceratium reticulatum, Strain CCCM 535 (=CCMP 1889)" /LENGTH=234 /DNA_ID=CAMNT_0008463199 /DNA_START=33 /DNA_END=737 /DNA_ORIENTATION=+